MDTGTGIAFIPMVQWPGHPWAWQGCSCKIWWLRYLQAGSSSSKNFTVMPVI
jgi:hypothetical protein